MKGVRNKDGQKHLLFHQAHCLMANINVREYRLVQIRVLRSNMRTGSN